MLVGSACGYCGTWPLRLCPCIRLRPSAVRPVGQGKNRTGDRTPGVKRQELPEEMNVHYGDPCHLLSVRYGTLCVRVLIEHWSSLGRVDVGIVVQVEPRARCRGCLRKCTWRWDVVAQQPGLGQGEGLRASIDCQAAHLGGQACSDPWL